MECVVTSLNDSVNLSEDTPDLLDLTARPTLTTRPSLGGQFIIYLHIDYEK